MVKLFIQIIAIVAMSKNMSKDIDAKRVTTLLSPRFRGFRRGEKVTSSDPLRLHSYEVIKGNFFHIIMQQMCAPLSFHKFTNFHPPEKGTDRKRRSNSMPHKPGKSFPQPRRKTFIVSALLYPFGVSDKVCGRRMFRLIAKRDWSEKLRRKLYDFELLVNVADNRAD